jgi:DNA primase
MAFFEREWINELLAKVDIADVIADYVTLINKSGKLWACCPFHGEKTPSFSVSKEKQFYYCFGCHESGNVIGFVMKMDNLTFPEAVEKLASKVSMPIPETKGNKNYQADKARLAKIYEINKKAGMYFYINLNDKVGKDTLQYAEKRGLDEHTIKKFGLGYSLDSWNGLLNYLKKSGYDAKEIKDAGLCSVKNDKVFDVFRNRIMFPIFNMYGDVIGFGGRIMDDSVPKYLNTSDTFAFNKRKNVYGLNFVKKIKGLQSVVLVEGYMDVISLYAKGIYNAVATLGTALTKEQAILIKRFVPLVYIAYDGDKAGMKATLKAIDILDSVGLDCKVIPFEDGLDPDEYIQKNGYNAFVSAAKDALTSVQYKLNRLVENFDLDDYAGKAKYIVAAALILKKLQNPIEREQYIQDLSIQSGYSIQAIKDQIKAEDKDDIHGNNRYNKVIEKKDEQIFLLERKLAEYFLVYPKQISLYDFEGFSQYLNDEAVKNLLNLIYTFSKKGFSLSCAEILTEVEEVHRLTIGEIIANTDDRSIKALDIGHVVEEFEKKSIENKIDALYDTLQTSNEKDIVLAKISEFNKELHNKKKKPNDGR